MFVYQILENWECSLIMEYEDKVVLTPPILSIQFSLDSNFILCQEHKKIVVIDIDRKQKLLQISMLDAIENATIPTLRDIDSKISIEKIPRKVEEMDEDTIERKLVRMDDDGNFEDSERDVWKVNKKDTTDKNRANKMKTFKELKKINKKIFKAKKPIFYYSNDETSILAVDDAIEEKFLRKMKHLKWRFVVGLT